MLLLQDHHKPGTLRAFLTARADPERSVATTIPTRAAGQEVLDLVPGAGCELTTCAGASIGSIGV